jgi:hypothetical protein
VCLLYVKFSTPACVLPGLDNNYLEYRLWYTWQRLQLIE